MLGEGLSEGGSRAFGWFCRRLMVWVRAESAGPQPVVCWGVGVKEATGPLRARDVCEALDHDLLPKNIEGTRAKLKRLVNLDVLTEIDTGSFTTKQ